MRGTVSPFMNRQPANQNDPQANFEQRLLTMRILWMAMFLSVVFYYVLTFYWGPSEDAQPNPTLTLILIGVALSTALISFFVKNLLLARAVEQQNVQLVQQAYIVALALTEVPGLLGLLDYLMTGDRYYPILFLISAGAQLLHFPRREHIINASAKRPIA